MCVVEFANSTRLAKFTKIKNLRNIWHIQYMSELYNYIGMDTNPRIQR